MTGRPENWVFLGDSLTEGIGSSRISYVTQLAGKLRNPATPRADSWSEVHEVRLRRVDPKSFNPFLRVNLAGHLHVDPGTSERSLWLWNLACEGRTINDDFEWLPWLNNLRPELVVIFRGSLESILRPAMLRSGAWPWWVPEAWRGYAGMDPRCYFSCTWWRQAKQALTNSLKQRVRLYLLSQEPGTTLMEAETFITQFAKLLTRVRELSERVLVLGLIPPVGERFPGSPEHFACVSERLRDIANAAGAGFLGWGSHVDQVAKRAELFYRDGFHPNIEGADLLAGILLKKLDEIVLE